MTDTEAVLDSAIATMQGTGNQILAVCKEKLHFGKTLNVMEVKELREILEAIAEALDQDSLLCQEAADNAKKEVESDDGVPSDVTWPESSPELHWTECLSRKDHIETFWGVDYDSDAMPNFSD